MDSRPPKVFLSYSYDSEEHADRVLDLSNRLCLEGIDCILDQYEVSPAEGWVRWMTEQIESADFVLMVCTETYYRRVERREEPNKGHGVLWESLIIYNMLYVSGTLNAKFIPVLFEDCDTSHVPLPVRTSTYHYVHTEDGYKSLYRHLSGQPRAQKPKVGELRTLPAHPSRPTTTTESTGILKNVPDLPPHFQQRPEHLMPLKTAILAVLKKPVVLTGTTRSFGVAGTGGIGKTVLAAALAHDPEVQHCFPDGVLWVTLGQTPNLTVRQSDLAEMLGDPPRAFEDVQQGKARLRELLRDKCILLILDDAWKTGHAAAFLVGGPSCRTLITTRKPSIVEDLGAAEHCVDVLKEAQALRLLADWTAQDVASLPDEAHDLTKECGYLPLALAMVGVMLRGAPHRWDGILRRLRNADLERIHHHFPDYPYPDLLRAIQVSVDALKPQVRDRYLDFAVFPEDTPIPEVVLHTLWAAQGLDEFEAQDVVETLVNHSLLHLDDVGRLSLHDLHFEYVRKQVGEENLPALHVRLLEAYAARCGDGTKSAPYCFAHGPDDGYFFQHLAWHLLQAGATYDMRKLLLDFDCIQAKLDATDAAALIADYDFLPEDEDLRLVQGALRLSAHVLARDKTQFAGQLIGRLIGNDSPRMQHLLDKALQWKAGVWLRPLTASLIHAGSPLIQTIVAHTDRISAMQLSADGQRVVTASHDRTIKVWDIEQTIEVRMIQAHSEWVTALSVTPDGRWAVSRSHEKLLKLWDLESGEEVRSISYSACLFNRVAITPDGRRAIVDSTDNALAVLDLMSGDEVVRMIGHERLIRTFVMNSKGDRVVTGSDDGIVKVWDIQNGVELLSLAGHTDAVDALAVSTDGTKVASASYDETVRVWDMDTGENWRKLQTEFMLISAMAFAHKDELLLGFIDGTIQVWNMATCQRERTLHGHSGRVTAIAVRPDGTHAISAGHDNRLRIWDIEDTKESTLGQDETRAVTAVAITNDGRHLLYAGVDRCITMHDLASLQIVRIFEGHDHAVRSISVSKDDRLAVTTSRDHIMKVWDLNSGSELLSIDGQQERILEVALTPDGRMAVNATYNHGIPVWNIENGVRVRVLEGHTEPVTAVAIMQDEVRAISASHDCTIRMWDLPPGEELRTILYAHRIKKAMDDPHIMTLAPLSDGRNLLVGYSDGILAMWDLEQGVELYKLLGHDAGIYEVVVARDDLHAVSSSWDHTVRFWDLKERRIVATFSGDSPIFCCAVSPDGKTVVAGGGSGALHFLRMEGV